MSIPPDPPSPTLKVRLDYDLSPAEGGNRLFFQYSGTTPVGGVLNNIASLIATAWNTNIAPLCSAAVTLVKVDVEDITSHSGAFGAFSTSHVGTRSGNSVLNQSAMDIEYNIARRYRGGKPRIYLPAGVTSDFQDDANWLDAFVTTAGTDFAAFIAAVSAISNTGTVLGSHVNLSFYQGFTNVTNTSGRTRAAPKYRTGTAVADIITGYAPKKLIGSQRRRRAASTF